MKIKFFILFFYSLIAIAQDKTEPTGSEKPVAEVTASPSSSSSSEKQLQTEQIDVAVGLDKVLELSFDFSAQMNLGDPSLLRVEPDLRRKRITLIGLKPGNTSLTIRDSVGDEKFRYIINVTSDDLSKTVGELRDLIGDVEGIEIGIKGGKVFVGGEIVVPNDIKRVAAVLETFSGANILRLIDMSPQTQVLIAKEMQEELQKNNFKTLTVRVVNKAFWVEGTVADQNEATLVQKITSAYLPEKIEAISSSSLVSAYPEGRQALLFFLTIDPKTAQEQNKEPLPKLVKISTQFVELRKDYSKIFGFKWAPLMSDDGSKISIGTTQDGSGTSKADGLFSAVITGLFPRLNSMKNAGYGRIVHSGMIITKEKSPATLKRQTAVPSIVGQNADYSRPNVSNFGLNMVVTPTILEEENVLMNVNIGVTLQTPSGSSTVPTENSIATEIMVKNSETAVLGGVMQSQDVSNFDKDDPAPVSNTSSNGQAPPRQLFGVMRSKNQSIARNQYVIFITPEIVASAAEATEEIKNKFKKRGR